MFLETSSMSAPTISHRGVSEFIDDILCAKNAFAASFDNSLLQMFEVIIFSLGT
jgi:hypothetical protein